MTQIDENKLLGTKFSSSPSSEQVRESFVHPCSCHSIMQEAAYCQVALNAKQMKLVRENKSI